MYEPLLFSYEIERLTQNNRTLFENLPDMLFIIKDDFVIEQMNSSAVNRFGNHIGGKCYQTIFGYDMPCKSDACPFARNECRRPYGRVHERRLGDKLCLEYSHVPFEGYRGDNLAVLILRDITQKKQHELKLEKSDRRKEDILMDKIDNQTFKEDEKQQLHQEIDGLKQEFDRFVDGNLMIGESGPIRSLRKMIQQVAESDATILITGESGTGKELIADLITKNSSRVNQLYLKINCAAVAESLLESELFGHEKGAFTGAISSRKGKFEEADGGTIFLDEIGDISPKMQSTLLRVLQDGEIQRVGSNKTISVNVRIVAATNMDLAAAVKAGKFREDLYYRLNVVNLHQLPLRERKEDIVLLATNFLVKYRERFNKHVTFLPNSVVKKLLNYDWPGNVRELENVIQRAVLLSRNGIISPDTLGISFHDPQLRKVVGSGQTLKNVLDRPLKESVSSFEAEVISFSIRACDGKLDRVSEQLGLAKTTLYEKIKRYGLNPKKYKEDSMA